MNKDEQIKILSTALADISGMDFSVGDKTLEVQSTVVHALHACINCTNTPKIIYRKIPEEE